MCESHDLQGKRVLAATHQALLSAGQPLCIWRQYCSRSMGCILGTHWPALSGAQFNNGCIRGTLLSLWDAEIPMFRL